MVHRTKEGYGDVSDNGVDEALQGFVLIRKIEREMDTKVSAGHEQFNSTCILLFAQEMTINSSRLVSSWAREPPYAHN